MIRTYRHIYCLHSYIFIAPKHARQCNAVAWNPIETNLIVSGLDKHSKDYSILLWDINKGLQGSERVHHHNTVQTDSLRPIAEIGASETVHSIAWLKHEQKCMVIGANNKHLKIIDFRGITKRTITYLLLSHIL